MRDIKFRIKLGGSGYNQWHYFGVYVGKPNVATIPETLGEYTGLEDNSGVDIFEGDIFRDDNNSTWPVEWSNKYAAFVVGGGCNALLSNWIDNYIMIVGNIHDDPGLLK